MSAHSCDQTNRFHPSRRAFLKKMSAGIAATAAAQFLLVGETHPVSAGEPQMGETWGMLIDLTRCTGCGSCALACKRSNRLPETDVTPEALDKNTYTYVGAHTVTTASGEVKTHYAKRQCMHCLNAACVAACPAAAMYKSEEGPVVYRPERCLGCRYCQLACPFDVPSFDWENGLTPAISKCWFCYQRLQQGQGPACAEACPTGALRFGKRNELVAQAHGQIASNPGRYVDHVFGEHEIGGTSMLYLSDVPFSVLGFPSGLPSAAPPEETAKVMGTLPAVIVGVAALMTGTAAVTRRRSDKQQGRQSRDAGEVATTLPSEEHEE